MLSQFREHIRYFLYLPRFITRTPDSIGSEEELVLFRARLPGQLSRVPTSPAAEAPKFSPLDEWKLACLETIGRTLSAVMYYAVLLALLAAAVRLLQCARQRQLPDALAIALGVWSAFLGAFAVNLLVQVTSFANMYPAVVAAAYSFLPLFLVFVAVDLTTAWRLPRRA